MKIKRFAPMEGGEMEGDEQGDYVLYCEYAKAAKSNGHSFYDKKTGDYW